MSDTFLNLGNLRGHLPEVGALTPVVEAGNR
jgi:hypothetical protein